MIENKRIINGIVCGKKVHIVTAIKLIQITGTDTDGDNVG
jgi:hypothetical protein